MTGLTILDKPISQHNGLYSLNDLHEVSGMSKKNQPGNFIRLEQTQDLINEIKCSSDLRITPISTIKGNHSSGLRQGTYVCKALVYAYAMWISPKFHLMVIRAFDGMVQQKNHAYIPDHAKPPVNPANLSTAQRWSLQEQAFNLSNQGISRFEIAKLLNVKHRKSIYRELQYYDKRMNPPEPKQLTRKTDETITVTLSKDEYIYFLEQKLSLMESVQ